MELECLRCGHKWRPRGESKPKSCPNCKQYSWDTPKKEKKEDDETKET